MHGIARAGVENAKIVGWSVEEAVTRRVVNGKTAAYREDEEVSEVGRSVCRRRRKNI